MTDFADKLVEAWCVDDNGDVALLAKRIRKACLERPRNGYRRVIKALRKASEVD